MSKGKSIELFFVDGHVEGLKTATIPFQWSGHVLVISRTQLKQALERPETRRPGVYLLVGERDDEPLLYIGETDEVHSRLKNHATNKDWWSYAICITSNGEPLNKGHVTYLESRLIRDARRIKKIELENGNSPADKSLSEAAQAHMDDFIENIYLVLPALRYDFFTDNTKLETVSSATVELAPTFVTKVPDTDYIARAEVVDGQFVVEAGSSARATWVGAPGSHSSYEALYNSLVEQGILVDDGARRVFAKAYKFNAPSAAGAIIKGRSTAGPTTWKLEGTTTTYREWESEQLSELPV